MPGTNRDPSFYWLKLKSALIKLAKDREKELNKEKSFQLELLNGYNELIMDDI